MNNKAIKTDKTYNYTSINADTIPNKSKRQNTKQNVIASYYAFLSSNNNDATTQPNKFKNARIVKTRRSKINRQRDSKTKRLTRKTRREEQQTTIRKDEEEQQKTQLGGSGVNNTTHTYDIYRPPLLPD